MGYVVLKTLYVFDYAYDVVIFLSTHYRLFVLLHDASFVVERRKMSDDSPNNTDFKKKAKLTTLTTPHTQ